MEDRYTLVERHIHQRLAEAILRDLSLPDNQRRGLRSPIRPTQNPRLRDDLGFDDESLSDLYLLLSEEFDAPAVDDEQQSLIVTVAGLVQYYADRASVTDENLLRYAML
jgi:acyl carrier protein